MRLRLLLPLLVLCIAGAVVLTGCGKSEEAGDTSTAASAPSASEDTYVCPMHPEVTSDGPDDCPECGMALVEMADFEAEPEEVVKDHVCPRHPGKSYPAGEKCEVCGLETVPKEDAGAVAIGSLVIFLPFCRWLCPLAAVLNPFSRFGLTRVKRNGHACLDCGHCASACPMAIPVDTVGQVTAARCLSCLSCVDVCAAAGSGAMIWGLPRWMGHRWSNALLITILLSCTTAAVAASHLFPLASFVKTRGQAPAVIATTELDLVGLTCRGQATLLMYFLERDDAFELAGYLRLEAWPGPGAARTRITYEPSLCHEAAIKRAITEPYYDAVAAIWRFSPFQIEGYDPLASDEDEARQNQRRDQ